jgi:histidinol-phosphate/aromatic aminotransferase/cobyric acid decarboxylase-like protein/choline kinase
MQAMILAAGMGKRLGELTQNSTKCMVRVLGQRIIERTLDMLGRTSVSRVVIVTGYKGDELRDLIGSHYAGKPIVYVDNPYFETTNNIYSLFMAREFLRLEDTILLESDLLFDENILQELIDSEEPNLVLVAKFQAWMDGTVVTLDNDQRVLSFIPKAKFDFGQLESYYKTVNIYKFSKTFSEKFYIPFLTAYTETVGHNEYYEDVLRVIAFLERSSLKAHVLHEDRNWYEVDDVQDISIAESIFATGQDKLRSYESRYGGYWRFPGMLDYAYLVNPYFPPAKLVSEMKNAFETLMVSYPSGARIVNLTAAKIFGTPAQQIVVGNGAAELIAALGQTLKGTVGLIEPTFEEYKSRLPFATLKSFKPNNADLSYGLADVLQIAAQVDHLILVNPDNPTGNFIQKQELLELAEYMKSLGKRLILDESFVDFTDEGRENTLLSASFLQRFPNLVVIKSLSKSYGVPGLRLGVMASADPALVKEVQSILPIWSINALGEYFLQIFDKYIKDYDGAHKLFVAERQRFKQMLESISNLKVHPSQANYFFCELLGHDSRQLAAVLLDRYGILIKDCGAKAGMAAGRFVRLAIRRSQDNDSLIAALQKELGNDHVA